MSHLRSHASSLTQLASLFFTFCTANPSPVSLRMFELEPLTKTCFGFRNDLNPSTCSGLARMGMLVHAKRLIEAIDSCLSLLGPDDELLTTLLLAAGRRHVNHGVRASYVHIMGDALLFSLAEVLGATEWTHEVEKAWISFFAVIASDVIRGIQHYERKKQQQQQGATDSPPKLVVNGTTKPPSGKQRRPRIDSISTGETASCDESWKSIPSVETTETKSVGELRETAATEECCPTSPPTSPPTRCSRRGSSSNSRCSSSSKNGGGGDGDGDGADSPHRGSLVFHFSKMKGSLTGSSSEDCRSVASGNTKGSSSTKGSLSKTRKGKISTSTGGNNMILMSPRMMMSPRVLLSRSLKQRKNNNINKSVLSILTKVSLEDDHDDDHSHSTCTSFAC
jgi:hemoglobin-like flavoprotein